MKDEVKSFTLCHLLLGKFVSWELSQELLLGVDFALASFSCF